MPPAYLLLRQHIEQVTPLTNTEFDYITGHFTAKKLRKHQSLIQEGESVEYDYCVAMGCLKAYRAESDGKEHILQFAVKDW